MTTPAADPDPHPTPDLIEGVSLAEYVALCRTIVRLPGDAIRRHDAILAAHDLTAERWMRIREGWSAAIRRDPEVRRRFRRLYAATAED